MQKVTLTNDESGAIEDFFPQSYTDAAVQAATVAPVDPKCANHLMSAARYFMSETVKANADPEAEAREQARAAREVAAARRKLTENQSR